MFVLYRGCVSQGSLIPVGYVPLLNLLFNAVKVEQFNINLGAAIV